MTTAKGRETHARLVKLSDSFVRTWAEKTRAVRIPDARVHAAAMEAKDAVLKMLLDETSAEQSR